MNRDLDCRKKREKLTRLSVLFFFLNITFSIGTSSLLHNIFLFCLPMGEVVLRQLFTGLIRCIIRCQCDIRCIFYLNLSVFVKKNGFSHRGSCIITVINQYICHFPARSVILLSVSIKVAPSRKIQRNIFCLVGLRMLFIRSELLILQKNFSALLCNAPFRLDYLCIFMMEYFSFHYLSGKYLSCLWIETFSKNCFLFGVEGNSIWFSFWGVWWRHS